MKNKKLAIDLFSGNTVYVNGGDFLKYLSTPYIPDPDNAEDCLWAIFENDFKEEMNKKIMKDLLEMINTNENI